MVLGSIKKKIVALSLGIIILTTIVVSTLVYRIFSYHLMRTIEDYYIHIVVDSMESIDEIMYDKYKSIQNIAADGSIRSNAGSPEIIGARLAEYNLISPEFMSLSLLDMNRTRLADSHNAHIGEKEKTSLYWERALEGKITAGEDIEAIESSRFPVINFAAPVNNERGKPTGVVVAKMSVKELQASMEDMFIIKGFMYFALFDKEKNILLSMAPHDHEKMLSESILDSVAAQEVSKGFTGAVIEPCAIHGDDMNNLSFYTSEKGKRNFRGNNWSAIMSLDFERVSVPLYELRDKIIAVSAVIILIVGVVSFYIARSLTVPIRNLQKGVKRIEEGDLDYQVEVGSKDETGDLAASFNKMVNTLRKKTNDLLDANYVLEREVHEREKAEAELKSYATRLAQSNRELQDFVKITSHDLQEPLRKIRAMGDIVKSACNENISSRGRDYIERIQKAAARLQTLIYDLRIFSSITSREKSFEPVNLNQVAREVITDLENRIEEKVARVAVKDLATVDADPLQMHQLLQNLIGNAIKFHKKSEPPSVKVYRRTERKSNNGSFELIVEDNGIGIDAKSADRIFVVFQRLHGRSEYEGTGMGLPICKKIAERHGGSITVKSKPGEGSLFIVTLPVSQGGETGKNKSEQTGDPGRS